MQALRCFQRLPILQPDFSFDFDWFHFLYGQKHSTSTCWRCRPSEARRTRFARSISSVWFRLLPVFAAQLIFAVVRPIPASLDFACSDNRAYHWTFTATPLWFLDYTSAFLSFLFALCWLFVCSSGSRPLSFWRSADAVAPGSISLRTWTGTFHHAPSFSGFLCSASFDASDRLHSAFAYWISLSWPAWHGSASPTYQVCSTISPVFSAPSQSFASSRQTFTSLCSLRDFVFSRRAFG